jgi:hypothetical protein
VDTHGHAIRRSGGSLSSLLGVSMLTHTSTQAATADCDRACLNGIVEKYVAALRAHDPSKAPIARGTVRSYQIKDGRTVTARNTAPWTWGIHEIFQINAEGQSCQVEAVPLSVPYGMRPAFSTGVHMPSPQAQKDGLKEY